MTAYLRKALGDHVIGKAAYPMPSVVYLALFKASPTDAGSFLDEVTGGSYARVSLTSLMSVFDSVTGIATNSSDVTFPIPSADWGTITHVGVIDQALGVSPDISHVLLYDSVPSPRVVISGGRPVKFGAGQLQITLAS